MQNPFRCFNGSPEVIRLVVLMYVRYMLSLRQVEDILNAEVMLGQWEFQCFGKGALRAAEDLIVSRFLLHLISEKALTR